MVVSGSLTALKAFTTVTSLTLRASPFPDFYWVHTHRTTGEVQLLPVIAIFVNSAGLAMYGYVLDDLVPLFATNVFGVFAATVFAAIFLIHTPDRKAATKMCVCGVAISTAMLLYTILATNGAIHESHSQTETVLGWITLFTTVAQFGSPLATMRRVIATKSSATLPLFMCIMNTVNSSSWVVYATVVWNPFLMIPCAIGAVLGVTQVALWTTYRPAATARIKAAAGTNPRSRNSVAITMDGPQCGAIDLVPAHATPNSVSFIVLASPCQEL